MQGNKREQMITVDGEKASAVKRKGTIDYREEEKSVPKVTKASV
ncbi:hypothetical protein [Heyndrickxia oleronia]